jgi:hypothetical protein
MLLPVNSKSRRLPSPAPTPSYLMVTDHPVPPQLSKTKVITTPPSKVNGKDDSSYSFSRTFVFHENSKSEHLISSGVLILKQSEFR